MPQQPKITGDDQEDSWALQVTQELNALQQRVTALEADIETLRTTAVGTTLANLITRLRGL